MIFQRFYLNCLAHASYIIADEDSREAAVIDPQRDTAQYLEFFEKHKLTPSYILETHLHADFVSGHHELACKTSARIVFSREARAKMPHIAVKDQDKLTLGHNIQITVLATPGHTPESVCYLVEDKKNPSEPKRLFSGDTLFVGDVGRPDLMGANMPASALAEMLYQTIQTKLKPLPEDTRVYPAHGAGSSCGKQLGDAEFTTIGQEKLTNYAFENLSLNEFVEKVTEDQPEAPKYFKEDAAINQEGAEILEELLTRLKPLNAPQFKTLIEQGAVVLDSRTPEVAALGAIPGSYCIGSEGQMAGWIGTLIPNQKQIIIIAEPGAEYETAMRCARIGYDKVYGFLKGGFESWKNSHYPIQQYDHLEPTQAHSKQQEGWVILDIRRQQERKTKDIPGSVFITLSELEKHWQELPENKPIIVQCASGYRSSIASHLLKSKGFKHIYNMTGGINQWEALSLPLETHTCNQ
jgi:glyoxylase-like metal-dependent hydrolase (beta-lactamase superfamily II)/rhodanese-related sulfurtransferase